MYGIDGKSQVRGDKGHVKTRRAGASLAEFNPETTNHRPLRLPHPVGKGDGKARYRWHAFAACQCARFIKSGWAATATLDDVGAVQLKLQESRPWLQFVRGEILAAKYLGKHTDEHWNGRLKEKYYGAVISFRVANGYFARQILLSFTTVNHRPRLRPRIFQ